MKFSNKSFITNTFSLYLMNIVKLVFPLLTLPYLTRILSTDSYGVVTYVKALNVYTQLIIDFGFLLSATKEIVYENKNKIQIGKIVGDTLIEKGILSLFALIFFAIGVLIVPILRDNVLFSFLYLLSSIITIFIFDFMFRGLEKMHLVAIPYVLSKLLTTVLTFMLIRGDDQIILIPVFEILGNGLAAAVSYKYVKKLGVTLTFSNVEKWILDLKNSSVYFISNFATTIFGGFTTVIAGFYLSMTNIAYWGLCLQLLSAAKALYAPITNSLYPYMIKEKDIKLIKKINIFMMIPMILGSFILIFEAESLMGILGGNEYRVAGRILKLLLPAFIFSFYSMIYGWPVLGVIGKEKSTTGTTIVASVVQIVALGLMVVTNNFTLFGLAISCSCSEFSLFITRYTIFIKNRKLFK